MKKFLIFLVLLSLSGCNLMPLSKNDVAKFSDYKLAHCAAMDNELCANELELRAKNNELDMNAVKMGYTAGSEKRHALLTQCTLHPYFC